jgi:hypothetical protein
MDRNQAKRNNQLYVRHIVSQLRTQVRRTQALMAVMAFQAAVKHTWQSSGQFASNWRISIGAGHWKNQPPDFNRGRPPVGESHAQFSERGMARPVVTSTWQKAGAYGSAERTQLFAEITARKGRSPEIAIFNPLFAQGSTNAHGTPQPYWWYATEGHPGHHTVEAIRKAVDSAVVIARKRIASGAWHGP